MPLIVETLLVACVLAFTSITYADVAKPRFLAVSFHADWCNGCKGLAPKIKQVRAQAMLEQKDILFVKLDLTNEDTTYQSGLLA